MPSDLFRGSNHGKAGGPVLRQAQDEAGVRGKSSLQPSGELACPRTCSEGRTTARRVGPSFDKLRTRLVCAVKVLSNLVVSLHALGLVPRVEPRQGGWGRPSTSSGQRRRWRRARA